MSILTHSGDNPADKPVILIVDDEPMNVRVLGEALAQDYHIKIATSGGSALAIANGADKPDLILLDIMMPLMDGYEVCRQLQSQYATRRIPIIFVTAKGELQDAE
jgi:putative two-component system response regulator